MSVFSEDIDKKIQLHKQKIEELEALKIEQEKKLEGIKEFDTIVRRLCNQNGLSEHELFVARAAEIEKWIISMASQEAPSSIYTNLQKHFEKVANKKGNSKPSTLPKPKLAVGTYKNPATQEKVEKIKRNPKLLDQWIDEYGFATVKTWKVD
ncbi:hypothetical protein GCM10011297_16600 [Bacterioplanes sanyensis]|uniref:hypothetical protein n=1 Tax=Bacterioplanes sanyensis TaxID=1249553 RepID=UPI001677C246|nr:hypothetical protein [Bacterioplanes sanyensis]GGY44335.1 hypothetical protein GCM10011297_16600 [Bacterioplanes sanyensis]